MSGGKRQLCLRKIVYSTWEEAEAAALHVMAVAPDGGGPLMAYACRFSDHYHIGHVAHGKRGRKRKRRG